jgi:beta-lactamase regulating signal transducer with metallopeptidase domain
MTEILNTAASHWWNWIWPMFWQSSLLILAVGLADLLLRRWTWPQVRYALYLLVLIKLLLPPSFSSPASLAGALFGERSLERITPPPAIQIPPAGPQMTSQAPLDTPAFESQDMPLLPPPRPTPPPLSWQVYLMAVWFAGVVLLGSWVLLRFRALRRDYLGVNPPPASPAAFTAMLRAAAAQLRLRRLPAVVFSSRVQSPAVFGVWRPVLVMPLEYRDRPPEYGLKPALQTVPLEYRDRPPEYGLKPALQTLPLKYRDRPPEHGLKPALQTLPLEYRDRPPEHGLKPALQTVPLEYRDRPPEYGLKPALQTPPQEYRDRAPNPSVPFVPFVPFVPPSTPPATAPVAPDAALRHILLHELAHIKRGDLHVHALFILLQILYWLHPLLWFVRRRLQYLRELCCDATVAGVLREETANYRETLLQTAARVLGPASRDGLGLLGLIEQPGNLLERLRQLEKKIWRHSRLRLLAVAVTVGVMFAAVLPMVKSQPKPTATETEGSEKSAALPRIPAWHLLRQPNVGPVLSPLFVRLVQSLDADIQSGPVWQTGKAQKTHINLDIRAEGNKRGKVMVGFFDRPDWRDRPRYVRVFPGPGAYVLEDIPPGRYYLGAAMGNLDEQPWDPAGIYNRYGKCAHPPEEPAGLGVQESWPASLDMARNKPVSVSLLLSPEFGWAGGHIQAETVLAWRGDWKEMRPERKITVRTLDESGRPVPFCKLTFVARGGNGEFTYFLDSGSDENGVAYCDAIDGPFSILIAERYDFRSETLAHLYQCKRMGAVYDSKEKPVIDIRLGAFPVGRGRIAGRVHDQDGNPVKAYFLLIGHEEGDRRLGTGDRYESQIQQPVVESDGRFTVGGLAGGVYTARVLAFDYYAYASSFDPMTTFTIPERGEMPQGLQNIALEFEAKERLYVRALFEDGSPVHPGMWAAWFQKDHGPGGNYFADRIESDGSFRVCLSKKEREELTKNSGGLIEISTDIGNNEYRKVGAVRADQLSKKSDQPSIIRFPRPSAKPEDAPTTAPGKLTTEVKADAERDAKVQKDLSNIGTALAAYQIGHLCYPDTLEQLTTPVPYLSKVPIDPYDSPNPYRYSGNTSGTLYLAYSVGPDGRDDKGDSRKDIRITRSLISSAPKAPALPQVNDDLIQDIEKNGIPLDSAELKSFVQTMLSRESRIQTLHLKGKCLYVAVARSLPGSLNLKYKRRTPGDVQAMICHDLDSEARSIKDGKAMRTRSMWVLNNDHDICLNTPTLFEKTAVPAVRTAEIFPAGVSTQKIPFMTAGPGGVEFFEMLARDYSGLTAKRSGDSIVIGGSSSVAPSTKRTLKALLQKDGPDGEYRLMRVYAFDDRGVLLIREVFEDWGELKNGLQFPKTLREQYVHWGQEERVAQLEETEINGPYSQADFHVAEIPAGTNVMYFLDASMKTTQSASFGIPMTPLKCIEFFRDFDQGGGQGNVPDSNEKSQPKPAEAKEENPLGLSDDVLKKLFETGQSMRQILTAVLSYRIDNQRVPEKMGDLQKPFNYLGKVPSDPFGSGPLRLIVDPAKAPDKVRAYSIGPDGKWDDGKTIDSSDPSLTGDLGAELDIKTGRVRFLADPTFTMHLEGKGLSHYLASKAEESAKPLPAAAPENVSRATTQTLVWGPEVNGLRAALELVPEQEAYPLGQVAGVRLHVRNVSRRAIQLASSDARQDMSTIKDANGKTIAGSHTVFSGRAIIVRRTVQPGETAVFKSLGLGIGIATSELKPGSALAGNILDGPPGKYTVTYSLRFPDVRQTSARDPKENVPQPEDWQGVLETGPREITVAPAGVKKESSESLGAAGDDAKTTSAREAAGTEENATGLPVAPASQPLRMVSSQFPAAKEGTPRGWKPDGKAIESAEERRVLETYPVVALEQIEAERHIRQGTGFSLLNMFDKERSDLKARTKKAIRLRLWFESPLFAGDLRAFAGAQLLDPATGHPPLGVIGGYSLGDQKTFKEFGNWRVQTALLDSSQKIPDRVDVIVRYTGGAWTQAPEPIPVAFRGSLPSMPQFIMDRIVETDANSTSIYYTLMGQGRDDPRNLGTKPASQEYGYEVDAISLDGRKIEQQMLSATLGTGETHCILRVRAPLKEIQSFQVKRRPCEWVAYRGVWIKPPEAQPAAPDKTTSPKETSENFRLFVAGSGAGKPGVYETPKANTSYQRLMDLAGVDTKQASDKGYVIHLIILLKPGYVSMGGTDLIQMRAWMEKGRPGSWETDGRAVFESDPIVAEHEADGVIRILWVGPPQDMERMNKAMRSSRPGNSPHKYGGDWPGQLDELLSLAEQAQKLGRWSGGESWLRDSKSEDAIRERIRQFIEACAKNDEAAVRNSVREGKLPPRDMIREMRESKAAGAKPGEIRSITISGDRALVVTEFFNFADKKYKDQQCLIYTLERQGTDWRVSDIDMESVETLVEEVQRFQEAQSPPTGGEDALRWERAIKKIVENQKVDLSAFYDAYRLENGEVLKRIAPPFIPQRADYYRRKQNPFQAEAISTPPDYFVFNWDGALKEWGMGFTGGNTPLSRALGHCGLTGFEFDGPADLLKLELPGDWIIRKDTSREDLLKALEQIIKKDLNRDIRFVKRQVERTVVVASGVFSPGPRPSPEFRNKVPQIHIYLDQPDPELGRGGASGNLGKFLRAVGAILHAPVIDETKGNAVSIEWAQYSDVVDNNITGDPVKIRRILDNLSKQTSLEFKTENRPVEVWFVTEEDAKGQPVAAEVKKETPESPVKPGEQRTPAGVLSPEPENEIQRRVLEEIYVLRHYVVLERADVWAGAIRKLTTLGGPAVPELVKELQRGGRPYSQSAIAYTLRAIGDRRAVPGLIRALAHASSGAGSDYGGVTTTDPELDRFMTSHQRGTRNGSLGFNFGRSVTEITGTLEKLTGHSEGYEHQMYHNEKGKTASVIRELTPRMEEDFALGLRQASGKWRIWWNANKAGLLNPAQLAEAESWTVPPLSDPVESAGLAAHGSLIPFGPTVSFGPVTEVTLAHATDGWNGDYLDFDSGKRLRIPQEIKEITGGQRIPRSNQWFRQNGVDVGTFWGWTLEGDKFIRLQNAHSCFVWPVDNARWETIEQEIRENHPLSLGDPQSGFGNIEEKSKTPLTYLIRTREGGVGMVQLLGFNADMSGIRIRYKMLVKAKDAVQPASPDQPPTRPQPEAGEGKKENTKLPDTTRL